jgi:hypothetical protein
MQFGKGLILFFSSIKDLRSQVSREKEPGTPGSRARWCLILGPLLLLNNASTIKEKSRELKIGEQKQVWCNELVSCAKIVTWYAQTWYETANTCCLGPKVHIVCAHFRLTYRAPHALQLLVGAICTTVGVCPEYPHQERSQNCGNHTGRNFQGQLCW